MVVFNAAKKCPMMYSSADEKIAHFNCETSDIKIGLKIYLNVKSVFNGIHNMQRNKKKQKNIPG